MRKEITTDELVTFLNRETELQKKKVEDFSCRLVKSPYHVIDHYLNEIMNSAAKLELYAMVLRDIEDYEKFNIPELIKDLNTRCLRGAMYGSDNQAHRHLLAATGRLHESLTLNLL